MYMARDLFLNPLVVGAHFPPHCEYTLCLLCYVDLYLIAFSLDSLIHFNACLLNLVVLRGFGVGVHHVIQYMSLDF